MRFPSVINYNLGDGIRAFTTTKGELTHAENPYSGFSVCHYVGDNDSHIARCRQLLADHINIPQNQIIIPRQTHSANVAIITDIPTNGCSLENVDALVTSLSGVALCINTADCIPILLADSTSGIIAAVHSGWRGTIANITANTIDAMMELGANPKRIQAAMGPSICTSCFEVGEEVADIFLTEFPQRTDIVDLSHPRPHINLAAAVHQTLLDKKIAAEHIALPPVCSKCNPQEFFSARHLGINSGRTLSLIYRL